MDNEGFVNLFEAANDRWPLHTGEQLRISTALFNRISRPGRNLPEGMPPYQVLSPTVVPFVDFTVLSHEAYSITGIVSPSGAIREFDVDEMRNYANPVLICKEKPTLNLTSIGLEYLKMKKSAADKRLADLVRMIPRKLDPQGNRGCIISSADMSTSLIAHLQGCNMFAVDDDFMGYGLVQRFDNESIEPPLVMAGRPRSSKWPAFAKKMIEEHPFCAACGATELLQCHHVDPYHLAPEKELLPENVIVLCMKYRCHLTLGHFCSWYSNNDNVVKDAAAFLKKVQSRP